MDRLRARVVSGPADPILLARALVAAGLDRVCLLHAAEPTTLVPWRSYLAAAPNRSSSALDPFAGDEPPARGPWCEVPRWIGIVPYEALRAIECGGQTPPDTRAEPLLGAIAWLRFPALLRVDHADASVLAIGESEAAIDRLARAAATRPPPAQEPRIRATAADPPEAHLARVRRGIELILAGDLYQVSLARRIDLAVAGEPLSAYAALAAGAAGAFGAALDLGDAWALSTSPELALLGPTARGLCYTEPIKGTRPRGGEADQDARLAAELDADEKERAELAMIIDVERNDLGRISETGSVRIARPPFVAVHRTVHHRKALLVARARPDASRREILDAMLPSGSVTGAPKIRAMQVIAALEAHRRGLYTGAFGYASHEGCFTLAMAIRTAVLRGDRGRFSGSYFSGGGIVADSDPAAELRETEWKAAQLASRSRAGSA